VNQNQPARFTPASPSECRIVGFWIIGEECGGRETRDGIRRLPDSDRIVKVTRSSWILRDLRKFQGRLVVFLRCDTRVAMARQPVGTTKRERPCERSSNRRHWTEETETEMKLSTGRADVRLNVTLSFHAASRCRALVISRTMHNSRWD